MGANTTVALVRRVKSAQPGAYGGDTYTTQVDAVPGVYWPNTVTETRHSGEQVQWQETVCVPHLEVDPSEIDALVPRATLASDGSVVTDEHGAPVGDLYEIDGVTVWPSTPWGWRPEYPIEIRLRRLTGGTR